MTGNPQDPTQTTEPNGNVEPNQPAEPNGSAANPEPNDWKAWSRHWEDMSKAKSKELDEARATLAQAVKRAEEAEAKAAGLEAAAERARTVAAVAAEVGVSAAVLERMAGEGEEDIRANAEVLRASAPAAAYPTAPQGGTPQPPAVTREQVMAIANSRERLKAIADNIDLF